MNRRCFISVAGATAAGIAARSATVAARSVNERVVLGIIGLGGRGENLTRGFLDRPDVDIAYLCDADAGQHPALGELVQEKRGRSPVRVQDFRRVLDDRAVDAVVIATPDHWHCPMTVFACMAGKDVYVEKPLSYDVWEGRRAVDAARQYNRVVQVGTQSRSAPYVRHAVEYVREGKLGDVAFCRVCNLKSGQPYIEPAEQPCPPEVDYDLWLGPAPARPFSRGRFHKSWHYYWEYSGGDMANDGVHQLDLARWLIGGEYPLSVASHGGNTVFDRDDNETPTAQTAMIDYGHAHIAYEQIGYGDYMLKEDPSLRDGDFFPLWTQYATRIELYGTKGLMMLGRHGGGWQVFAKPKSWTPQVAAEEPGLFPDDAHKQNFIECVRSRSQPNADVEEGHRTAVAIHLANISCRLKGAKLTFDAAAGNVVNAPEAEPYLRQTHTRRPYAIPDEAE
jgi:predicted dehydrogenase